VIADLAKNEDASRIAAGVERVLNPGPDQPRSLFGATDSLELETLLDEVRALLRGIRRPNP
jgi:hypothetical protein